MKTTTVKHLAIATVFFATACDAGEARSDARKTNESSARQLSPDLKAQMEEMLKIYEAIRAQLAQDEVAAIAGNAQALAKTANDTVPKTPKHLTGHLQELAKSASKLKDMDKSDADTVRRNFGEVSRAVVALILAAPALQSGRYVFECPMAQGYTKWVQPSSQIANPYMGTRMLECGASTKWKP